MASEQEHDDEMKREVPGLAHIRLSQEQAAELTALIDKRAAPPRRAPRDLPEGDPSLLYAKGRQ